MNSFDAPFTQFVSLWHPKVEACLAAQFDGKGKGDLDTYLYRPFAEFSSRGGKRLRPILCLLGCMAAGGNPQDALSAAIAIENFQSAALIHDDIADEGDLRRGKPCLHRSEGIGIAINVGDLALVQTSNAILSDSSLEPAVRCAMLDELSHMMLRTLEGQALDLGWVRDERWDITPDDYRNMATLKTAHYSAASPLAIGATLAQAPSHTVEQLRSIGLAAGLAFQLQDDLLNLVGDPQAQGKDWRSDITEGKRTLIALVALERMGEHGKGELLDILSSHQTNPEVLARAVQIMEETGAIACVHDEAQQLAATAASQAKEADLIPEARDILAAMASFFVSRLG